MIVSFLWKIKTTFSFFMPDGPRVRIGPSFATAARLLPRLLPALPSGGDARPDR